MGLFNRVFKRCDDTTCLAPDLCDKKEKADAGVLVGSLSDLAATLNVMTVQQITDAVAQGEFNVADVVAAESSSVGKKRKGVLALG